MSVRRACEGCGEVRLVNSDGRPQAPLCQRCLNERNHRDWPDFMVIVGKRLCAQCESCGLIRQVERGKITARLCRRCTSLESLPTKCVAGCGRPPIPKSRGMCGSCYRRDLQERAPRCATGDGKPAMGSGYCKAHHERLRLTGSLGTKPIRGGPPLPCVLCGETGRAQTGLCSKHHQAKWRAENAEYVVLRKRSWRHKGIGIDEWAELLAAQGGRCYLCGDPLGLMDVQVDHDHRCCGQMKSCPRCRRGLACKFCNMAVGMLRDDPARVRRVAEAFAAAAEAAGSRLEATP